MMNEIKSKITAGGKRRFCLKRCLVLFLAVVSTGLVPVLAGCGQRSVQNEPVSSRNVKAAVMKGPTAMGMVYLMQQAKEGKTVNQYDFTVAASADEFTALLVKGDIQIAALPCNAAATLYNKTDGKIKILGINTLGVLYILDTGMSVQNVSDLRGKIIYTTGKGTTPEYTLRYLLRSAGLDPDRDVVIEFKSEAAEVAALMAENEGETVAMLPQPYVTTVMMNNSQVRIALDVTAEWEKQTGADSTVVTGVLAVNADYYEKNRTVVEQFIKEYTESTAYVNEHVTEAAQLVEDFGIFKAAVAQKAIPYCNITFVDGEEMKQKVRHYLLVLYEENPLSVGGKMPDEAFYAD